MWQSCCSTQMFATICTTCVFPITSSSPWWCSFSHLAACSYWFCQIVSYAFPRTLIQFSHLIWFNFGASVELPHDAFFLINEFGVQQSHHWLLRDELTTLTPFSYSFLPSWTSSKLTTQFFSFLLAITLSNTSPHNYILILADRLRCDAAVLSLKPHHLQPRQTLQFSY